VAPGVWFWIIYVVFALLGVLFNWPVTGANDPYAWRPLGWSFVVLILLGLLGWGIFGPPIRG
jgi:hypothetical protein